MGGLYAYQPPPPPPPERLPPLLRELLLELDDREDEPEELDDQADELLPELLGGAGFGTAAANDPTDFAQPPVAPAPPKAPPPAWNVGSDAADGADAVGTENEGRVRSRLRFPSSIRAGSSTDHRSRWSPRPKARM
jgi:hypothetical protein